MVTATLERGKSSQHIHTNIHARASFYIYIYIVIIQICVRLHERDTHEVICTCNRYSCGLTEQVSTFAHTNTQTFTPRANASKFHDHSISSNYVLAVDSMNFAHYHEIIICQCIKESSGL